MTVDAARRSVREARLVAAALLLPLLLFGGLFGISVVRGLLRPAVVFGLIEVLAVVTAYRFRACARPLARSREDHS